MRLALFLALAVWFSLFAVTPALAVKSVRVSVDADAIDLSSAVERYSGQGDKISVSVAPGPDKIERRIEVSALEAGANPSWIVFALTNDSDEQLSRLVVAPHYRFVGSGVLWPDLGSARITTITASQGEPPEREDELDADVFRVTLDPGSTVTYVAELSANNVPQIYLWEPDAYKDNSARLTLFQGIVIGIAGLLALFLTMVFVVRGALMFPAAAALAWAVFAYVCIDFGFWRKILNFDDASERIWRASVEATIGATLIVFLFAYLNLRRWHVRFLHIGLIWLLTMAAVIALSVYNAPIAAGVARISIASAAGVGLLLILSLAVSGSERALLLIPTWFLLSVWVAAAGATVLGNVTNDLAAPGLIGGLVLIVMLIGFTIMQSAFATASGLEAHRRGRRTARAGDDRLRRFDLRLERRRRPDLRQPRRGDPTGPEARRARGTGGAMDGYPSSARSRPLRGVARRAAATALGPHSSRLEAQGRRRALRVVPAQGAPGAQRPKRSGARHRLARRRHRRQGLGGAHPAGCDP